MSEGSEEPQGAIFPPWFDKVVKLGGLVLGGGVVYMVVLVAWAASPRTTAVGYEPDQPVDYSHRLHVGELGMDCRYCHNTVEDTAHAAIPATQSCMNCHTMVRKESDKLTLVRESFATGQPIPWKRVHDLPDYVYFDHSAHVRRGVGCVSCHGRIDQMEKVRQVEPLNMGWCIECHRNPEEHLRPKDKVTEMDWTPGEDQAALGRRLREEYDINPSTDCNTCHR